ncbi:MAG: pyrophosphatase [Bacteroidetes bacterium GWF2_41_31]|nr:MAG: pyrophosphatase [Bacteroidetes bacterium GWF2_41_31]
MTIEEAQQMVDQWINTTGVRYFSELTNMALLTEEVGEVARVIARRYGDQSFKSNEADADLADELADVLFVVMCLANQTGINLTDALKKNMEKKDTRDVNRHRHNKKLSS